MFGFKVETRLVKDNKEAQDTPVAPLVNINSDEVQRIAKNIVKYVAIGTAAVLATAAVLNTASDIIVHKATEDHED